MKELHRARSVGKEVEPPCLVPKSPCVHQPGSSQNLVLLGFCEDFNQPPAPPHAPEVSGGTASFQPSNPTIGSMGNQPLSLGTFQQHSHWHKRLLFHFQHLGICRGFRSCEAGIADNDQICVRNICWSSEWPNICISYKSQYCKLHFLSLPSYSLLPPMGHFKTFCELSS